MKLERDLRATAHAVDGKVSIRIGGWRYSASHDEAVQLAAELVAAAEKLSTNAGMG